MSLFENVQNLWPQNMREASPAAPDEVTSTTEVSTNFQFPVFSSRTRTLGLIEIYLLTSVGISYFITQTSQGIMRNADVFGFLAQNAVMALNVAAAFLLVMLAELTRSKLDAFLVGLSALVVFLVTFTLSSWHLHAFLGVFAAAFLLDRFVCHGVLIRSSVPCPSKEAQQIRRDVQDRFDWHPQSRFTFWSYLVPILIVVVPSTLFRARFERYPQEFIRDLPFIIVFMLLAYPFVANLLAPWYGGQRYSLLYLVDEPWKLFRSFLCYNARNARHPAVFKSPAGPTYCRLCACLGVLLLFAPLSLPNHYYQLDVDAQYQNWVQEQLDLEHGYDRTAPTPFPDLPRQPKSESLFEFLKSQLPDILSQSSTHTPHTLSIQPVKWTLPELQQPARTQPNATKQQPPQAEDLTFDQLLHRGMEKEKTLLKDEREQTATALQETRDNLTEQMKRRGVTENPAKIYASLKKGLFLAMAPLLPIITLIAFLFAGSSRTMARYATLGREIPDKVVFTTANWKPIVERLRDDNLTSGRPAEILIGCSAVNQSPVVIPQSVIREHVHFLGDTGSGKSTLGLSPLIAQLLASGDCSVIVLDLKGDDQSLFELVRLGAQEHQAPGEEHLDSARWRYPFRYFSTVMSQASHLFNPMMQKSFHLLNSTQKADLLSTALGLQYGTDYGRKYFGDANFNLLQAALEHNATAKSFAELLPTIAQANFTGIDRDTKQAASNLKTSVQRLASVPALNFMPGTSQLHIPPESCIDLIDLFETPQAIYFNLPAATGSVVNAELARLVLFSLISSAQAASKPRKQVFVIADEFQRVVSRNIEVLLQMARSHDVGVILANQSLGDLNQRDANILSTVTSNTRLRQIFGVNDPAEIRQIIDASGESVIFSRALSAFTEIVSGIISYPATMFRETPSTRLRVNDLIEASDHPFRSVLQLKRGAGLAQYGGYPFVLESVYHITEAEYQNRRNTPWPAPGDSAKIVPVPITVQAQQAKKRAKLKARLRPLTPDPLKAVPDDEQYSLFPETEPVDSETEEASAAAELEDQEPPTPPADPAQLNRLLDDLDNF